MSFGLCCHCRAEDPIFRRSYSGERLCIKCFCKSIQNKVRATISRYQMLKPKDWIMVAVSGGKDSIILLHILEKMERNFSEAMLCAITIDEGIRDYREKALKIAEKNCQKLGIMHLIVSFKEAYGYTLDQIVSIIRERGEKGLTPCAYCGALRRRILNKAAREAGANRLVTAHNLDDETQTILLNIIHGHALQMARAMHVSRATHPRLIQRVKPFCEVPEKEIVLYGYLKRIEFQDRSCPYAQTALRNDIRITLNRMEEKHAGTKFTIFKSMERIRPALESMLGGAKLQNCKKCGEPTSREVCKPCQMLQELSLL